jgi:peptidoglycan hydrolase CwlO-like protein
MTRTRYLTILLATALTLGALPAQAATPTPKPKATPKAKATATPVPTPTPTKGPSVVDLEAARTKLEEFEKDITAGETGAKRLQTQLRELSYKVSDEQGTLSEIDANLKATTVRMKTTKQRLISVRKKMRERARSLYKQGPGSLIAVVLGSENMRDFVGRMHFASRLADQDEDLVLQTRARQGELEAIKAYEEQLFDQQRATVATVKQEQEAIIDVFAKQQAILARLAEARADALDLVASIESQLSSGEFRNLKRVAGRGMTVSYDEWARGFLEFLGVSVTRESLIAVVAWEASEGTQATWNPLATTMAMDDATVYNSHGVRNYVSRQQGYEAVVKTLQRPNYGYERILDRFERASEAMDIGIAINKSHWCRGCTEGQYVIGIIPAVERYYEEYAS